MSAIDTTPTEEIDEAALAEHLATEFGDADEYAIEPLTGGSSNDTLLVRWGDREFAMRYPPAGRPVPGLLHDVMVEHEALSALSDTWVPTPDPVLACRDDSVIGKPFYLMELVEGDVLGGEELERLAAPEHRRAAGWEVIDVLAGLHDLDHTRLDIETEAVEADLEGAIEAHTDRLEDALERTREDRPVPRALEVGDWLADNVPESPDMAVVHGDYKPDNFLFAPGTPPRMSALLDWEMFGLGDPLTDLGWLLAYWSEPRDPGPLTDEYEDLYEGTGIYAATEGFIEDETGFMEHEGYPTRQELVRRYEVQTGLGFEHDRFYRALGLYKLAGICERFYALYLEDPEGSKETYPIMQMLVPLIAERATLIIEGETPL